MLLLGQSWNNDPGTWPNQHHIQAIDEVKGEQRSCWHNIYPDLVITNQELRITFKRNAPNGSVYMICWNDGPLKVTMPVFLFPY